MKILHYPELATDEDEELEADDIMEMHEDADDEVTTGKVDEEAEEEAEE
jgi:hypothetical protein